jgi:hypothetical protein
MNYWSSELVLEDNVMEGLGQNVQSANLKTGVWSGPIAAGGNGMHMSMVLRNNTNDGVLLPETPTDAPARA